jgi:hypothetical protein
MPASFGIPDPQSALEKAAEITSGITSATRKLMLPMAEHLSNVLQTVNAPIVYAQQFANRRLGRIAAQQQRLTSAATSMIPPQAFPPGPAAHLSIPPQAGQPGLGGTATFCGVPGKPPCPPNPTGPLGIAITNAAEKCDAIFGGQAGGPWCLIGGGPQNLPLAYTQCAGVEEQLMPGVSGPYACCFAGALAAQGFPVTLPQELHCGQPPTSPPTGYYCCVTTGADGSQNINPFFYGGTGPTPAETCGSGTLSGPYPDLPTAAACGKPPPPPPITPPTPTQPATPGSSCDTPLYMKMCVDKKPAPGTCTTDEQGNVTCTPAIQPITPTLPGGNGGGRLFSCSLMPDGTLPPVGSPEWCACLDQLVVFFSDFGAGALGLIGITDPNAQQQQTVTLISQLFGSIQNIPLIGDTISGMSAIWSTIPQSVYNSIVPVVQQIAGTTTAILGLAVARTIMRLLKNLRIGTDALLWATIDIDLTVSQVETIIEYVSDYVLPTEIPSIGDALECALLNTAPPDLVKCWLLCRGANPDVWQAVLYARREKLTTEELIELMRRDGFTDDSITQALRNYGWMDEGEAASRVKLYNRLPERADFLHYLQRNVYDNDYVARYQLLDGFQERYLANFGDQLHSLGITVEQSALDYAAHWINASPGEMRELLYRLSPDMPGTQNPFTLDDYERLLAEQDYAPWVRKRMVETAYRVPALGYLRDMYRQYVISDEDMKLYHRKLGYTVQDSERFVQIDQIIRTRIRASESHGWVPSALGAAFAIGVIPESELRQRMQEQGFTDDESNNLMRRAQSDLQRSILVRARSRVMFSVLSTVKAALEAGAVDQQTAVISIQQLGWPAEFASGWVDLQNQAARIKLIKQVTARIRSAFLAGEISADYASAALSSVGISAQALALFLAAWLAEMTPRRKRRTASQIVNDLANGELTESDALLRLFNLGYDDADQKLFLADAQRKIIGIEARRSAAAQRTNIAQAKALKQLLREQRAQHKELLAEYKRISSPSKLQKQARLGLIGRDLFYDRLRAQEFPDNDIGRLWDEACQSKNGKCVDTTPAPETPPPGIGGTGYPPDQPE